MVSEKDLKHLSSLIYGVDKRAKNAFKIDMTKTLKNQPSIKDDILIEEKLNLSTDFKILKVADNPINGMQAMAVAPIIKGTVDMNQIVIVYAGTNF